MPLRSLRVPARLAFAALAAALAACGDGERRGADCAEGDVRACYTGAEETRGVGPCQAGTQRCVDGGWGACTGETLPADETCNDLDDDCDGVTDDGARNACGGCEALAHPPGAGCEGCGTWTCAGADALACAPPSPAPGDACTGANACAGRYVCNEDRTVTCAAPARNNCGACADRDVDGLSDACTGADGCTGRFVCDDAGTGRRCDAPFRNECGACAPRIASYGETCTNTTGCAGHVVDCSTDGTTAACDAPPRNECDACKPAIANFADPCVGASGCAGEYTVCSGDGAAAACDAPARNECGACGPAVPDWNAACTNAAGCAGRRLACATDGLSAACAAPARNECGACGPAIPDWNAPCTNLAGCAGHVADCATDGLSASCDAPLKNQCGACAPPIADWNAPCTGADGCPGHVVDCASDGRSAACDADPRNQCGACAPPIAGWNAACSGPDGCPGHVADCATDGRSAACDAPAKNQCGACAPPIANWNAACTGAGGCPGHVVDCASDGRSAACDADPRNQCGACAPPIADWNAACTGPDACPGRVVDCATDGLSAACDAVFGLNACGACGPPVAGLGDACTDTWTDSKTDGTPVAESCTGVRVCNGEGTGTVCRCTPVLAEICGAGPDGTTDDFVVLHNPTPYPKNVTGYSLWYAARTNTTTPLGTGNRIGVLDAATCAAGLAADGASEVVMPPFGYLLFASPKYKPSGGEPPADCTWGTTNLSATAGQIWLASDGTQPSGWPQAGVALGPNVVDLVAYGNLPPASDAVSRWTGAVPAPPHPAAGDLRRRPLPPETTGHGLVTHNGTDWIAQAVRTPRNLASPPAPFAAPLLSEIATEGTDGPDNEFIELYNPAREPLPVVGVTLWYGAPATTALTAPNRLLTLDATTCSTTVIPAGGHLLVARAGGYLPGAGEPAPDCTYASGYLGADGGQLWLTTSAAVPVLGGVTVLDLVGWGTSVRFEGAAPAPAPDAPASLERKARRTSDAATMSAGGADAAAGNGYDTQRNATDFVVRPVRDPQAAASAPEVAY